MHPVEPLKQDGLSDCLSKNSSFGTSEANAPLPTATGTSPTSEARGECVQTGMTRMHVQTPADQIGHVCTEKERLTETKRLSDQETQRERLVVTERGARLETRLERETE